MFKPVVLSFKMGEDEDYVLVKFQSDSEECAVVSVQKAVCPVYDQMDDVSTTGSYQFLTGKAGITVKVFNIKQRSKTTFFEKCVSAR